VRMFVCDTWGQAMALVALGVGRRAQGRLEDAVSTLHRAVEVSESGHHPVTGSLALAAVGYCHLDAGDLAAAEVSAERSLAMLTGMELEPHALVGPRVLRAQVLRARGRVDLALALLEELAEAPYDPSLLFPRRQALAHLAGARLEIGEPDRALRTAQHAMAVPAEDVRSRIISLRVLAACLAACDDAPAARFALRQALALAGSTEQVAERAATRRALDQLEALAT
jgi:tetratricopeptide (TPR) repeat protein